MSGNEEETKGTYSTFTGTENYNRNVFLRWAPEMNGNWNPYGLQPVQYVQTWIQMYTAVKAIAPKTAMVWAPNTGQGWVRIFQSSFTHRGSRSDIDVTRLLRNYSYPYSMALPTDNQTEANALDTDGDGTLTYNDSPFSPYYPGDEYVDWIGLSVYYKGPNSRNINVNQPDGYCYGALYNYNPNTGNNAADPWYDNYCAAKPHIACMVSESTRVAPGDRSE